jgi:hypothetical protein
MSEIILGVATGAKTGSTVGAVVNGTTVTVEVARDLTVADGDVLVLAKFGAQWTAIARKYTSAPSAPINQPGPDPNPGTVTGKLTVGPVETRSYRNSSWRTDNTTVYQGQYGGGGNHTGCVFYGGAPRSLAGAIVLDASMVVRRENGGAYAAQATTMRLMTNATRPAGAPTLTSSTAGPSLAVGAANTGGFSVPTSWVQAMVDGTAGGLAFFTGSGSPYVRLSGLGDWGPAFTLTIAWQR